VELMTRREGSTEAGDGTQLYWQAWLPPEPTLATVWLVHGGAEHGGRYAELVDSLLGAGCAVYAPDLRGHGRSGGRRGSIRRFSDYVGDLDATVRAAGAPTDNVFVLGYSLGAIVGASYALECHERLAGVIMAAPALGPGAGVSRTQFALAGVLSAVAPRLPLFRQDPSSMMQDPDVVRAYRADPLVHQGRFNARVIGELVTTMGDFPARIAGLQPPLLVLHGADDVTADPERSRLAVERAGSADKTLNVYDGMRHDLFHEPGRARVIEDTTTWLESQCPR
jgi:alpha-beta hydrolase superfamily lysophospholipase